MFVRIDEKKPSEHKNKIGEGDLMKVLLWLGQKPSKSEVKLIIWVGDHFYLSSFRKSMTIWTVMSARKSSKLCIKDASQTIRV